MPSKEHIFDNIADYTPTQIADFIRSGIVTFDELKDPDNTGSDFAADAREKVEELLNAAPPAADNWDLVNKNSLEELKAYLADHPLSPHAGEAQRLIAELEKLPPVDDWDLVNKQSINALQSFIDSHPGNSHVREAKDIIEEILGRVRSNVLSAFIRNIKGIQADKTVADPDKKIFDIIMEHLNRKTNGMTRNDLVKLLTDDHNLLSAGTVRMLFYDGIITDDDFKTMGIDDEFVEYLLSNVPKQKFPEPTPLTQINKASTEIYFWGIPSSGKSCALGGILSVASNGQVASHISIDNHSQGYGYMVRLMQQFSEDDNVVSLPEGTAVTATFEMGFDLVDLDGLVHPITCVDLAGETIRNMFKFDSGEDIPDDALITLDNITHLMNDTKSQNRKMHFFVIEYGADDRLYEGLPQKFYLDAAVQYIRNYEIFRRDTDAIYILVSKVDKAPKDIPLKEAVTEYITKKYRGFYNKMKAICIENEINGGTIDILPFTLGEVCFQDYCRFKEEASRMVVKEIIKRTPGYRTDKINKFKDKFKG